MKKRIKPISLKKVKRYSVKGRKSKVDASCLGTPLSKDSTIEDFISSLPDVLAAKDLKEVVQAIVKARKQDKQVVLAMGAHPIKVGLSPIIIDLMNSGIITAIATNGAAIVHDFEIAYAGHTSEDVAESIVNGSFGMAKETAQLLNRAIKQGAKKSKGIGYSVGELIAKGRGFANRQLSIFYNAYKLQIPATVHVAIGTDIIHMHPECDGSAVGKASHLDFRLFTSVISELDGGVFINLGSAVLIPEVFLKAITLSRNLGNRVQNITTVTMDFMRHYRPAVNVVHRPTLSGGRGYYLVGHHEIMFPLLAAAVKNSL
ncbi:MAG: hypothetical protein GXO99_07265 [Nitrospirae bacterium]|nr:hypothetical protein [Nitrospirota bacterium]